MLSDEVKWFVASSSMIPCSPDEHNEEVLRRSAESTMLSIARTIFGRLYDSDPAEEEAKLRVHEDEPQHGDISLSVPTTVTPHKQVIDDTNKHGEETSHMNAVTQDVTLDMVNTPNKTTEGSVQSVAVPRPCGLKSLSLERFSYVVYYRWASCSLGAPSGACEYS